MLVLAQLSSTKTSLSGSRSIWPSNQSRRCFRTSGRSCSEACAVFFTRQVMAHKEAPQRSVTEVKVSSGKLGTQFLDGHVPPRLEHSQDQLRVCFDRGAAPVPTQRPRPQMSRLPFQCTPTANTGSADLEASRQQRDGSIPRRVQPQQRVVVNQATVPSTSLPASAPAGSLNPIITDSGIPLDSISSDHALVHRSPGSDTVTDLQYKLHAIEIRHPSTPARSCYGRRISFR